MLLIFFFFLDAPAASEQGSASNDYNRRIQPITQRKKRNLKKVKK